MKISVDLGGAIRKTAALLKVPQAARKQLQRWGAQTVKALKLSARDMKRSGRGRKTGQLARSVGMRMAGDTLTIGTNVDRQTDVKYARIQDEGGTIRAKNKKLTVPFPGVKGRARDYKDTFFITSKSGNVILCQRKGKAGLRPLFTLRDEVTLSPTYWFRNPWQRMESLRPGFMDEKVLYAEAEKMAGLGGA